MNKKQKMKMLAAVLAAGSLYINGGTAFAETVPKPPTSTGMSQQSQDNDVTIVVEDYMDQNSNTGKWEFNEKTGDTVYDFQKQINFSTTGGTDGNDMKVVISSLGSVGPVVEPGKGMKVKHYTGSYAYLDYSSGKLIDEEGNLLAENFWDLSYEKQDEYVPVLDTTTMQHTLDVGSKVLVTTTGDVASGITVNGEEFDINPVEFNKNEPAAGGGKYKGNWQIIDKTTGEAYENTTLDRVETVSEGNTYDGYGRDYNIYDTADNELTLKDVASASKLKDVDKSAVKYDIKRDEQGNIIYDYSKITLGGDTYNNKRGGTELTNVAYAGNIRDENGKVLGSAAVNVDYLNDQLDIAKAAVTKNDQHLNYNKDYAVDRDKNEVKLEVVDNQGNLVGETVIKDVASATDVGDITEIHDNLKNEDGSETSVVDAVNNLDDKVGDLNYKHDDNSDLNYVTAGDSVTEAIGDLDAAINNAAAEAGKHTSVSGSDNISVTQSDEPNSNGGVNYEVSLKDDITLGDKDGNNIHLDGDNGNISATGSISAGNITINGVGEDGKTSGTIGGLSNTSWDWDKYNKNEYANSSNAATEGQLHGAMQGTVQYDRNEDGSVNKGSITLGGEEGTSIHNVAPGRVEQGSMDAVNGGQLYDMQQNMGNRINNLDNRISKVGAGAAALAALHPLDFDPDDKLSFAVGYGNYRGENAAAVGAFYQPNEDTLFSLGGTVGNDENMVNVGVSFKLGQKNHVSNNRVSMAKEIISLRDKVAKLEALMTQQGLIPQSEIDMDKFFPDVPENHWAYEYVKELARLGIIDGYPDGTFSGDRMMTRYEFAAITYRALQKGVNVDKRMITEFEPELKLIRVDVVAQDKDGNPTIERVRTNEQK